MLQAIAATKSQLATLGRERRAGLTLLLEFMADERNLCVILNTSVNTMMNLKHSSEESIG